MSLVDRLRELSSEDTTPVDYMEQGRGVVSETPVGKVANSAVNTLAEIIVDMATSIPDYVDEVEQQGTAIAETAGKAYAEGTLKNWETFDNAILNSSELAEAQQKWLDDLDDQVYEARMTAAKDPANVLATGVSAFSPVAGLAITAPFIAHDMGKAFEQGEGKAGEAAKGMALPVGAGMLAQSAGTALKSKAPMISKLLTTPFFGSVAGAGASAAFDPNMREYMQEHKGRAIFNFAGTDIGMGARKLANWKGKTVDVSPTPQPRVETQTTVAETQPNTEVQGMQMARKIGVRRANQSMPVETPPKSIAEEVNPSLRADVKSTEKIVKKDIEDKVQKRTRVQDQFQGAYGVQIKPSRVNVSSTPVTVEDIFRTAKEITPANVGRMKVADENILGYHIGDDHGAIRLRQFTAFSTLSHEVGHEISARLGWGRTPETIKELKDGALSVWKKGECGDPHTPKGHLTYVEEGRALFMNEYMLDPDLAKKHFPLSYAQFEQMIVQDKGLFKHLTKLGQQIRRYYSDDVWQQANASISYANDKPSVSLRDRATQAKMAIYDNYTGLRRAVEKFEKEQGIKLDVEDNPADQAQHAKSSSRGVTEMLLGTNGANTHNNINALSARYGVSLNYVTQYDTLAPIRALEDRMKAGDKALEDFLTQHSFTKKQGFYEVYTVYSNARRVVEVIKEKNKQHIENLKEKLKAVEDKLKNTEDMTVDAIDRWEDRKQQLIKRIEAVESGKNDYKTNIAREKAEQIIQDAQQIPELGEAFSLWQDYNENLLRIMAKEGIISVEKAQMYLDKYPDYIPMQRSFITEGNNIDTGSGAFSDMSNVNIRAAIKSLSKTGSDRPTVAFMEQATKNTASYISKIERNRAGRKLLALSRMKGGSSLAEPVSSTGASSKEMIVTVLENGKEVPLKIHDPLMWQSLTNMDKDTQSTAFSVIQKLMESSATMLRIGATSLPDFALRSLVKDLMTATLFSDDGTTFTLKGRGIPVPIVDQLSLLVDGVLALRDKKLMAQMKAEGVTYSGYVGNSKEIDQNIRNTVTPNKLKNAGNSLTKAAQWLSTQGEMLPRAALYRRGIHRGRSRFQAAHNAMEGTANFARTGTLGKTLNPYTAFLNATIQGVATPIRYINKDNYVQVGFRLFNHVVFPSIALWAYNSQQDWYKDMPIDRKNRAWFLDLKGDGSAIIAVPKAEGLPQALSSVIERSLDWAVQQEQSSVVTNTIKDSVASSLPSVIPTAAIPYFEWQANYNFFRKRQIEPKYMEDIAPELRYNLYTSEFAKGVGRQFGVSPMKVDNTLFALTASLGKLFVTVTDATFKDEETPAKNWNEHTSLTYSPNTSNSRTADVFYSGLENLKHEHSRKGKGASESRELKGMKEVSTKINTISTKIRAITNTIGMDGRAKRDKIDELTKKRNNLMRKANSKYLGYKYIQNPN